MGLTFQFRIYGEHMPLNHAGLFQMPPLPEDCYHHNLWFPPTSIS